MLAMSLLLISERLKYTEVSRLWQKTASMQLYFKGYRNTETYTQRVMGRDGFHPRDAIP